jgi:hypothetical protein
MDRLLAPGAAGWIDCLIGLSASAFAKLMKFYMRQWHVGGYTAGSTGSNH